MSIRGVPRRLAGLAVVLLLLAYAGCAQLPHSGPVVVGSSHGATETRLPSDIDPEPPQHGESRLDVVDGFLEAMTAWPITTSVAKQYLTDDAAREWNPEAATMVYANFAPPTDDDKGVTVRLSGAARLDSAGAWRGQVPADGQTLRFTVVRQHGEYRIANPPDAMVVPTTWFQQRFGQVALYYFDSASKYLVPEPVFVPLGDQLPTALVEALLAGPPEGLRGVVRTFLPAGLSIGLSVPVSGTGVADINLVGEQTQPSSEEAELLVAQLAATLRDTRHFPMTLTFLVAYLFYNDGIQTVIVSASVYGEKQLGFSTSVLIATILLVQFVAFGGALLFGKLAERFGSRRIILAGLGVWMLVVTAGYFLPAHQIALFMALAVGIGLVMGGTQALSRSFFSLLIPRGREAEYFSLYQACERGTSWLGTLVFGLVHQLTDSYRPAIFALIVFFVVGGVLLARVDPERGIREAGNTVPTVV